MQHAQHVYKYHNLTANEWSYIYIEVKANNCSNDSIKFGYPNVNNVKLQTMLNRVAFVSIETNVTSILTYNWNTAATDIKYVLVESFESAECFWKVLNSMSM